MTSLNTLHLLRVVINCDVIPTYKITVYTRVLHATIRYLDYKYVQLFIGTYLLFVPTPTLTVPKSAY